jgi:CNP1-like family protein
VRGFLLLVVLLEGCGASQPVSDWERRNAERLAAAERAPLKLPAYPQRGDLVEFYVSPDSELKYYIDPASLRVEGGREVRYVMVARSPEGAENVSFESIRCPDEYRLHATGRPNGTWAGQESAWRPIPRGIDRNPQYALARNYFCPHRDPIRSAAEGVDALKRGSHPFVFVEPQNMGR